MRFIQDNFRQIAVLKEGNGGLTELVMDAGKNIFVRKTIPYTGLPYQELMQLSHPMLPKIYYAAEDEGNTFVIEQHIEGQNLQEVLEHDGPLPEQQVRDIALQLCDGLEYLHKHRIIHRDIKPSNIIIQENGAVRLIDFGAARVARLKPEPAAEGNAKRTAGESMIREQDTRILGTPGFAPPEQYGFATTDYRSDYYALGMTLQALSGKSYRGSLTGAIRRCVELDPERRIQNTAELRHLLQPHWYAPFAGHGIIAALLLCVLLGGGAWWFTNRQYGADNLPAAKNAVQENGNTREPAKVPPADSRKQENAKEKHEKAESTNILPEKPARQKEAGVTQNGNTSQRKDLQQRKPLISVNSAGAVQVHGRNWNNLSKTEQHLAPIVPDADKVVYAPGNWPVVMVTNASDEELKNPRVDLYFSDFGVLGQNFSVSDWDGRTESIEYTNKNVNGVARHVTMKFRGAVPAHDRRPFSLFGGVSGLYRLGANPSVRVVFSADNAPAQEKSMAIGVK